MNLRLAVFVRRGNSIRFDSAYSSLPILNSLMYHVSCAEVDIAIEIRVESQSRKKC